MTAQAQQTTVSGIFAAVKQIQMLFVMQHKHRLFTSCRAKRHQCSLLTEGACDDQPQVLGAQQVAGEVGQHQGKRVPIVSASAGICTHLRHSRNSHITIRLNCVCPNAMLKDYGGKCRNRKLLYRTLCCLDGVLSIESRCIFAYASCCSYMLRCKLSGFVASK